MNDQNLHYATNWIFEGCNAQHRYIVDIGPHLGDHSKIRQQMLNLLVENGHIKNERITKEYLVHGSLTEKGIKIRGQLHVK